MDYLRIYNQIIKRAVSRKTVEGYSEKHHIIPRCLGGSDNLENIVTLTAREHFICHWLLAREYGGKMWYAFHMMCNVEGVGQQRYVPSSRVFEELRENFSKVVSESKKGVSRTFSKQHRNNLRKAALKRGYVPPSRKGLPGTMKGKHHSQESIEKMKVLHICPYCGKEGRGNVMKRHHFSNCKVVI